MRVLISSAPIASQVSSGTKPSIKFESNGLLEIISFNVFFMDTSAKSLSGITLKRRQSTPVNVVPVAQQNHIKF